MGKTVGCFSHRLTQVAFFTANSHESFGHLDSMLRKEIILPRPIVLRITKLEALVAVGCFSREMLRDAYLLSHAVSVTPFAAIIAC